MPTTVTMPQLGESVSEGTVGRWLKREGELVKKDESLVEIITDKVTAELPSPVSGRLTRILVGEDQTVGVGAEIAEIDEGGASVPTGGGSLSAVGASGAQNGAQQASAGDSGSNGHASAAGSFGAATATLTSPAQAATQTPERVSPLARRMAQEHNIDLSQIHGTGEGGRVRKEDILAYVAQRQSAAPAPAVAAPPRSAPTSAPPTPVTPAAGDQVVTPSPARRLIAEHMVRSKQTAPHAWTMVEVDMTGVARWLDAHREAFKRREGYGVSFQTFAIKAAVESLKEYPSLNASWTEDGKILLRKDIHIGVSIALNENLIVPVIRHADTLSVAGIARAVNDLVTRARSNKLLPADLQGSTFTVNNPGVFGTLLSMAIINQPNAGILTLDAVVKRPVVIDDAIAIRSMMYLSLSLDHRLLDGATAAQFLGAVKRRLESVTPEYTV